MNIHIGFEFLVGWLLGILVTGGVGWLALKDNYLTDQEIALLQVTLERCQPYGGMNYSADNYVH